MLFVADTAQTVLTESRGETSGTKDGGITAGTSGAQNELIKPNDTQYAIITGIVLSYTSVEKDKFYIFFNTV